MSSPFSIRNAPSPLSLAFVTGASSGIGAALCQLLAAKKIALIITGRDQGRLDALAEELRPLTEVTVLTADIAKSEGRAMIVQAFYERRPDLIINNAGFGLYGEALSHTTQAQLEMVQVNAQAVLELTLEGARSMVEGGKKGIILNVSSAAAPLVFPNFAVYAASKAFVNQVSEALDFEMGPKGIRVLTACPGMVSTSFSARAAGRAPSDGMAHVPAFQRMTMMTPKFAAEQIWRQIEQQQRIRTFDWKTRFGTYLARLLPTKWSAYFLGKSISDRLPSQQ